MALSIDVPASGWHSEQGYFINKDAGGAEGVSLLFWDPGPVGIYADPCAHRVSPPAGPSTADLAAAVAKVPGTDVVSAPSNATVAGRAAKHVVITVREDVACGAGDAGFHLWYRDVATGEVRYATALGVTLRVWIVDVDGTRLFIEGESYNGAGPKVEQEIQQMVDSIRFE